MGISLRLLLQGTQVATATNELLLGDVTEPWNIRTPCSNKLLLSKKQVSECFPHQFEVPDGVGSGLGLRCGITAHLRETFSE